MAQAPGLSVSRSAPQGTGWRFQATFPLRCKGRPSPSLPLALQTPVSGPYTCFALQTPAVDGLQRRRRPGNAALCRFRPK